MATKQAWKCPSCGYENSALDSECLVCKEPRPASAAPSGRSAKFRSKNSEDKSREHLTVVHYIAMVLLVIGFIAFVILTPLGKKYVGNRLRPGLIMNFSTTSFDVLAEKWAMLGAILLLGGAILGACSGGGVVGAVIGGILGFLIYAAICYICSLFWNYAAPFIVNAGVYMIFGAVASAIILGCAVAIVNYAKKLILYINPYPKNPGEYDDGVRLYYKDKSKHKEEYAHRRSYFFGPGFFSIWQTIKLTWIANFQLVGNVRKWLGYHMHGIEWLFWIPGIPFFIFYIIAICVFGSIVTVICSLLHAVPTLLVMVVIYVLFSITWLIDRIYLQMHSIKSNCAYCHERAVIPQFECPECHSLHAKLVPGPYGIWHRRCVCGKRLPTTFLLGRSKLNAYCPHCGNALAASDVQQFSISLVGGSTSGKTYLLTAYFHELFDALNGNPKLYYEIPQMYADMFKDLEDWFNGSKIMGTLRNQTSYMYSVLMNSDALQVRKQFSIYDIAGEAFEDQTMSDMHTVYHFRDSNGLIIIIDPLTSAYVRDKVQNAGVDVSEYAQMDTTVVIQNFASYLKTVVTSVGAGKKDDRPVAVVITKTDLPVIDEILSYEHMEEMHRANANESFSSIRDAICEDFLNSNGFSDALTAVKVNFANVHYFPVSAIGHEKDGQRFTPKHVAEPFNWIISTTDAQLAELMGIENPVTSAT